MTTAGGKSLVIGRAIGRLLFYLDGTFDEVDLQMVASDSPMLLVLTIKNAMGWRVNLLTNAIAIGVGSIMPVYKANGHPRFRWSE